MDFRDTLRQRSNYVWGLFLLIIVTAGWLFMSAGSTIAAHFQEYEQFLHRNYFYASSFIYGVGMIFLLIAFLSSCSHLYENSCLAKCSFGVLIVILILEILVGVAGILMRTKAEGMLENVLYKTIGEYNRPDFNETTDLWDKMQDQFHCCGIRGVDDWNTRNNSTKNNIPISCCQIPSGTTNNFTCTDRTPTLNPEGCLTEITGYIEGVATNAMGFGIGLACFQLLIILASCCMYKRMRSDYETV